MSGHVYGYIRVSTKEQCIDRQMQAMREAGVAEKDVYIDRQSGKDFSRPAYQRLRRRLSAGDTLIVKSIDRLGRLRPDSGESAEGIRRVICSHFLQWPS